MTPLKLAIALALLLLPARCLLAQDATADQDALPAQTGLDVPAAAPNAEQFVPPAASIQSFAGGVIALRDEATVPGTPVLVKNICRWTEADALFFQPVADLTVTHFSNNRMYMKVTLDEVRDTLRGAGMNLALISFGGATACAVNRTQNDEQQSLQQWIDSHQAVPAAATEAPVAAPAPFVPVSLFSHSPVPAQPPIPDGSPLRSLRDILVADLAGRLQVDVNNLELFCDSSNDNVLKLVEPYFQFAVTPQSASGLGEVSWDVVITSNGQRRNSHVTATARLWQLQTVLQRPEGYRQVIRPDDVIEKRVLVERLPEEPLLSQTQAVGQETSRELKPGTILTASMVDPALLARPGQIVTVNVVHGSVSITAVAKAMEAGSYGQTIRARNDVDPTQVFEVTLTGPQEGTVNNSPDDNKSSIAAAVNGSP